MGRSSRPSALAVPLVKQQTDHTCGPAALLAVLRYLGKARRSTERSLAREMATTPDGGTLEAAMLTAAAKRWPAASMHGRTSPAQLRAWLDAGAPAILGIQAYGEGHYVVAVGHDARGVACMDPSLGGPRYARLSWDELAARWYFALGAQTAPGVALVFPGACGARRRLGATRPLPLL